MGASRRLHRRIQRRGLTRERKAMRRAFVAGARAYLEQRAIVQQAADEWDFLAEASDIARTEPER